MDAAFPNLYRNSILRPQLQNQLLHSEILFQMLLLEPVPLLLQPVGLRPKITWRGVWVWGAPRNIIAVHDIDGNETTTLINDEDTITTIIETHAAIRAPIVAIASQSWYTIRTVVVMAAVAAMTIRTVGPRKIPNVVAVLIVATVQEAMAAIKIAESAFTCSC
jgi:hypothetical protein